MSRGLFFSGVLVAMGVFFGFFYLGSDSQLSLAIVTATTVGAVGIPASVRYVIFHKADARRMGWDTDRPEWAHEVGFANRAFGVIGLPAVGLGLAVQTQALVVLGYAVYLLQAAILHGDGYIKIETKSPGKRWRRVRRQQRPRSSYRMRPSVSGAACRAVPSGSPARRSS